MSEPVILTGIVLRSVPSGEYDRRVVLLTRERGKITAFARGARRPGSTMLGSILPFCFGRFTLYEGRSAYTMTAAAVDMYFASLREDLEASCYGMYLLELAEYYGRENLDAAGMLNLLYLSLRALENAHLDNRLVRYVYEIRLMVINGEYPQDLTGDPSLSEAAAYALYFVIHAPLKKLFTFTVTDQVLEELARLQDRVRGRILDRPMKSLEMIALLEPKATLHPQTNSL